MCGVAVLSPNNAENLVVKYRHKSRDKESPTKRKKVEHRAFSHSGTLPTDICLRSEGRLPVCCLLTKDVDAGIDDDDYDDDDDDDEDDNDTDNDNDNDDNDADDDADKRS